MKNYLPATDETKALQAEIQNRKYLNQINMADKQFVGKTFEKTFSNGGSIIRLLLTPNDLDLLKKEMKLNSKTQTPEVAVVIQKSQKGNWYAAIDTWQPSGQGNVAAPPAGVPGGQITDLDTSDDLPF